MQITNKYWAVLTVLVLTLALAGCSDGAGLDDEGGIGRDEGDIGRHGLAADSGESRFEEADSGGSRETEIGGFSVQGPQDEEISIPEAEADPGEVAGYYESVRDVLDDTPDDFSSLLDSDAGLEGDTANLGLNAESVEGALESNEGTVEDLQQLETPNGLGEIQDQLVDSRERAASAYDNINQTFVNDASSDEVADAVEESLPEIEYSDAETRAILQELERASND